MLFVLPVPVTSAINPILHFSTVLLIVNRTMYILSKRSAVSALATCTLNRANCTMYILSMRSAISALATCNIT